MQDKKLFGSRNDLYPIFEITKINGQGEQKYGQDRKPGNQVVVFGDQPAKIRSPVIQPLLEIPKSPAAVPCKDQPGKKKHGKGKRERIFGGLLRIVDGKYEENYDEVDNVVEDHCGWLLTNFLGVANP